MQEFQEKLIAPCGMNCNICSAYLAYSRDIPKIRGKINHCSGCRIRNKFCAFIKKSCTTKLVTKNKITYCFECHLFPCDQLKKIDNRYQTRFNTSFIENLNYIKQNGAQKFLKQQQKKFQCPECKGTINIHSRKCVDCKPMNSWRG